MIITIIGDKKVYNEAGSLYNKLAFEMKTEQWNSITFCSAFLTKSAAESIIELIKNIKTRRDIEITIIIGVKNNFTEPDAIKILLDYIEDSSRNNLKFSLKVPQDNNFHIKCYVFLNESEGKAIVGSANLTDNGLESNGELMVEVDDNKTVDAIVDYINNYLNKSVDWCLCINEYFNIYKKNKPIITETNTAELFKKKRFHKIKQRLTIRFVAPTMGIIGKASKEQEERVQVIFENTKRKFPDINKSYWIIYSKSSGDDLDAVKANYPIGSCFDRPKDINHDWEIKANRIICNVGAVVNTLDDEIVMFMKKGCIHYVVTEKIIRIAEKLGIKSDDEDYIPTKEEIDKYKQFILNSRNK